MSESVNTEHMFFNAGNENTNMPKCDAPVEKLEVACRTSKQQHPFDEKGKTLGTNEAESSSRKEPLENCWPSLSEYTPDLGREYINLPFLFTSLLVD